MFIPAFLRIFSDFKYDKEIGISYYEIVMAYSFETLSYLIWLSVFYVILYKFGHKIF